MELFKHNTKIDFMGQRKIAATISIILMLASIGLLIGKGLNLGLDFVGGTQIEVTFAQTADIPKIRENLAAAGYAQPIVQSYGTTKDVLIRISEQTDAEEDIKLAMSKIIPNGKVQAVEVIGPQVGRALLTNGILAVVVALIGTMLYIAMRFEYRFAVSAAVALIHDPIITLGIFSLFGVEFNLIALAAILAIIGYSLNDTIVVYDRVRENFRKMRKDTAATIMNVSINQTLSRTIMTSGLTLLVVIALLVYGGETLFGFSLVYWRTYT